MTDRHERDPTRIAQLLASEVTGRSAGPLGRLAVIDAVPDATPSADGALAYRLALDQAVDAGGKSPPPRTSEVSLQGEESVPDEGTGRGGDSESGRPAASRVIGAVHLHQEAAVVSLPSVRRDVGAVALRGHAQDAGQRAIPGDRDDVALARDGGRLSVEIRSGAAVKPAVDVLTAVADRIGTDSAMDDVSSPGN
jgi:hypothetical protein